MKSYKNYLLNLLLVILAFNYVDRLALGLLLQDIKAEFALTDTQLGLLSGIAFAVFYSVMGIPIARWADRGNRVAVISVTAALWSAAVALCGVAGSFIQLLLIRIGVAVGEAGCVPPAHSLIADYFTRSERPRAMSRYMLGVPLSYLIGYFLAGWTAEFYGWRWTFIILGFPGLFLAALAWFTVKEPRRYRLMPAASSGLDSTSQSSFVEVSRILWSNGTFRHVLMGFSIACFFGYGIAQWQPAFFMRSHGTPIGELGTWSAVLWGAGGLVGSYLGGEWASRRAAQRECLQLKAVALMYCCFVLTSAAVYLSPNAYCAFAFIGVGAVGVYVTNGPLFATIQTLVPAGMRAISVAIIYLFANLIGMGLGPLAVGVLSDSLRPWAGEESLRHALLMLSPGYLWAAWHMWRASRTVTRDLEVAAASDRAQLQAVEKIEDSVGASLG